MANWLELDDEGRNRAEDKALDLLRSALPGDLWSKLEKRGVISVTGKRGVYIISPMSQTEIRDVSTGRLIAHACLQLSVPAPRYDRVLTEYLLIKNDEEFYWNTANIFSQNGSDIAVLLLAFLDFALFVNLLLELLQAR